jgi:hypothetical protein
MSMAGPKKQTPIEQIISVLKDLVTEPATDQSSGPPTAADVRRVKSEFRASTPRKKKSTKTRARPASKKKRATTRKKATTKRVSRKKTTRTKRSKHS